MNRRDILLLTGIGFLSGIISWLSGYFELFQLLTETAPGIIFGAGLGLFFYFSTDHPSWLKVLALIAISCLAYYAAFFLTLETIQTVGYPALFTGGALGAFILFLGVKALF